MGSALENSTVCEKESRERVLVVTAPHHDYSMSSSDTSPSRVE